ncbi:MAG: DUF2497 domain-containing protein [Parvularculaceae bacterium]
MANAQPEPSMEEILASIRRIISEDEEDGDVVDAPARPSLVSAADAAVGRRPTPVADVENEAEDEDSAPIVLAPPSSAGQGPGATAPGEDDAGEDQDGAKPRLATEDVEMIKNNLSALAKDDNLVDDVSAASAASAFGALSQSVRVSDEPGRSLEELIVEMLRPMLKTWLDDNLPAIVEEKVQQEVERIARRAR